MAMCQKAAAKAGYVPDVTVAVTQVPAGRPAPADVQPHPGRDAVHRGQLPPAAVAAAGGDGPGAAGLWGGGKGVCAVRGLPGDPVCEAPAAAGRLDQAKGRGGRLLSAL